MLKVVVCIKQVPLVSELPWDPKTGTLKREVAPGMMNPACRFALEAALLLREVEPVEILVLTMGPPMAEEVLREAVALGANRGVLLTDRRMAGADTFATSHTLARAIQAACADFDLVLCGYATNDSETAQVGPQLAEELGIPCVSGIERIALQNRCLRMERLSDGFLETLEMPLPGLVSLHIQRHSPRYVDLAGLQQAFGSVDIRILGADDLGLSPEEVGVQGSCTRILNVYSPTAGKKNVLWKGAAKEVVERLLDDYGHKIGAAMGKDLKGGQ